MSETQVPEPIGNSDPRPIVALPRPGLSNGAIALLGIVFAVLLFVILDTRRLQRASRVEHPAESGADSFPAPPPLEQPAEAPALPTVDGPVEPRPLPLPPVRRTMPPAPPPPQQQPFPIAPATPTAPVISTVEPRRQDAPAVVFAPGAIASSPSALQGGGGQAATTASAPSDDDAPIGTTVIRNHTMIMPTGTVIPAVLETPIDSTRPGLVRAVVSDDARGFDGKRILIPRGSRLIGDYASDVRSGQKRVLVTWSRLIRPDGVAVRIGSPAADTLGGAGIPGRVNTYFLQRFAGAVLQSALQVGVNLASRPGNGSVIVGLTSTSGGVIGQDLIPSSDLKPRIRVKQGTSLTIFVAHDLDFSGTPLIEGSGSP